MKLNLECQTYQEKILDPYSFVGEFYNLYCFRVKGGRGWEEHLTADFLRPVLYDSSNLTL